MRWIALTNGREERGLDYGGVIRRLREGRGLTMDTLAGSAGISTSYLSEVERGLKRPSTDVIAKIAEALQMRASEFLARVESSFAIRSGLTDRMESPRLRAKFSARLPAVEAAFHDMRAPLAREDLIQALLSASERLRDEDLRILLELAMRLRQAEKS